MPAESDSQLRAEREALRARLAELEGAEETARALIGVVRELVGTLDLAQSIDRLVTTVLDLFRVRRAVLYRIEPASGTLLCVAAAGEGDPAKWIGRTLEPDVGLAGLSVSQGGPVWSPDPLADPRVTLPEWARDPSALRRGHGAGLDGQGGGRSCTERASAQASRRGQAQ